MVKSSITSNGQYKISGLNKMSVVRRVKAAEKLGDTRITYKTIRRGGTSWSPTEIKGTYATPDSSETIMYIAIMKIGYRKRGNDND